jgi:predicted transposase YdaD
MTLETRQNEKRLFKEVAMNLSPVYDAWQERTLAKGISLGREEGISLGREQGIPFGQLELLKRQLTAKFDRISPQKLASLDSLNSEQLSSLAIALLSFGEMADFDRWLESNCIKGG